MLTKMKMCSNDDVTYQAFLTWIVNGHLWSTISTSLVSGLWREILHEINVPMWAGLSRQKLMMVLL